MTNEQGAKWLLQEMYDEGYRDIKIIGVYAYFVNPTFIENGGHFKVREHTPRIPCKVLGLGAGKKEYSIANILGIVEWEKVPVDTPILIKGTFEILKRYFAKYENGYVYFYSDGRTSSNYEEMRKVAPSYVG
ncbi:MAG: hypothetical protein E6167_00955, partial [Varibaculum cambriense]|nr:hypothetical protein [Varibaculum cambriense]